MPPSIRHTTAGDGARIAYATLGEGVPVICMPPVPFSHLEAGWDVAGQRRWFERLARHAQVALYDGRGTGLSDRDRAEFGLDALQADLEAVARQLGWDRFALCGFFNAAPAAIAFAARRPEAVSALVLWGGFAKGVDVYPMPVPAAAPQVVEAYWPVLVDTAAHTWTASGDDAVEVAAYFRRCVAPEAALRAFAAARDYDVEALLPTLTVPTLIVHRPHARGQRHDLARSLAARIPGSELAPLEGDAASPFAGDVEGGVEVIEGFLGIEAAATGESMTGTPGQALDAPPAEGEASLTPREAEVLRLLARGLPNKSIARELGVSIHTVERHLTNLYPKLGCRSRTEATAYAITHGYA